MIKPHTQTGRLLSHLEAGKTVNRLSALTDLGIFELSARVIDLEHEGYRLHKERKPITNRFGETARVVEYSLEA